MKLYNLILLFFFFTLPLYSTSVPKRIELETGASWNYADELRVIDKKGNTNRLGAGQTMLMLAEGWQLGGLNGGRSVWLSIPLEFSFLPSAERNAFMITYGWKLCHELSTNESHRPFMEYGLLISQLYFTGIAGGETGHHTMLSFGWNFGAKTKTRFYLKSSWDMMIWKSFLTGRQSTKDISLRAGFLFPMHR